MAGFPRSPQESIELVIRHLLSLLRIESLQWNLVSNLVSSVWKGVMSVVAVPVYLALLGDEAFGVVSYVQTLHALFAVLDLGIAATVTREIPLRRKSDGRLYAANLLRTFEWINWLIAIIIGVGIAGSATWVADQWLIVPSLSQSEIILAITLGGFSLAARWPVALYSGVLRGLERQVLLNCVLVVTATTRVVVTSAMLLLVSRSLQCFLFTQIAVNFIEAASLGLLARRFLDKDGTGRFDKTELQRTWRFALSFNLVGALGMLVTSADRLLITKLLPITDLTYYAICLTATGPMLVIYSAVASATFPRMSYLWGNNEKTSLLLLYQYSLRLTTYACLGPIMLLVFFPEEILYAWTRSQQTASTGATILPVMAFAVLINCANGAAYNVIISTGHTRLPLLVNAVSVPLMFAACLFAIQSYGLVGASFCCLIFHASCFLVYGIFCQRFLFGIRVRPWQYNLGFPVELLLLAIGIGMLTRFTNFYVEWHVTSGMLLVGAVCIFYLAGFCFLRKDERSLLRNTVLKIVGKATTV